MTIQLKYLYLLLSRKVLVKGKVAPFPTRTESELINPVEYWYEELVYQFIDSDRTGLLQVHPEQFATLPTSE